MRKFINSYRGRWTLTVLAAVAWLLLIFVMPADAAQEVCPETGKVESQVDGDLDDIVLAEGVQVCIKGGNDVVYVVADGESTLADLLNNNKNVSHYTVIEVPPPTTTTTSIPTTTSTSVVDTTTTVPSVTTTTTPGTSTTTTESRSTTTSESESTTTTNQEETTTTAEASTTTSAEDETSSTTIVREEPPSGGELPFTGIPTFFWLFVAVALSGTGGLILRKASE